MLLHSIASAASISDSARHYTLTPERMTSTHLNADSVDSSNVISRIVTSHEVTA